jgi:predicted AlkP superfamily pyrophosphatase or phosphodiesterase
MFNEFRLSFFSGIILPVIIFLAGSLPAIALNSKNLVNPGEKPDLIVGIVVEKMRYDYLTRMWSKFGDNGFKRLVTEGSSFTNARYDYLTNQSSSGYATIFTGANPSAHGVIADNWYNRLGNNIQSSVFDDNVFAVGGSFGNGRRSPSALLSATVGDELRMASDFRSKVFSVSLNDVAAVLSGGFSANGAWWFDPVHGEWMSSSYYIDSLPGWVKEFNSRMLPDLYLDRAWEPSAGQTSYFSKNPDTFNTPFHYDLKRIRRRSDDYSIMKAIPQGNTFTKDFALSVILNEQLGRNGHTDMIVIGFSAMAEIDHQYGTFSKELQDAYLRLDRDIAHLLTFLEATYGKDNTLVFLTADQAVSYPTSYNTSARIPGGIFSPSQAMSLLRSYLNIAYGQADWVSSYNAGMIYLNHSQIETSNISLEDIQYRSSRFLNQFRGVAGTITEDVFRRNFFSEGIPAKIQAGFHPKRSGDIMLYLQQGWFERGFSGDRLILTSYDQHVPLVFYGWNIGNSNYSRPVSMTDIAPTISMILNIPIPQFTTGKPIMELLK